MSHFFALKNTLRGSNALLDENEFKIVLAILDEREVELTQELSPLAQLVLRVFDIEDLKDNEFYEVQGRFAKNRTQLLSVLMDQPNPHMADVMIHHFG